MSIIAIRTVIIYILVITAMRIMGKRQLGELQPAELVVALLISDLAAVPMQENGMPLLNGIIPILILVALELLLSGLMLKVPFFQRLIGGRSKIIINDGKIDVKALNGIRMTIEDLMEALRQQSIFDLREVQYAIVEPNGRTSFLLKPGNRPATCQDLELSVPDNGIPMIIISDGKISRWGLDVCGLDKAWVNQVLIDNNCTINDVFLLMADRDRTYHLIRKEQQQ
ncbi:MAG: DUF421 domain-containing protein [Oscillospiraceae bacterium]|nr:DUF421 domain-containing protein [Oscillospiraceae bacterium]MDD3833323.1 DUF421 domain-containing protein [Oscillospiraceae bacterium]MDD4546608.1 DUF421 domain-containing protein [Oscillospiraceae bacterium]